MALKAWRPLRWLSLPLSLLGAPPALAQVPDKSRIDAAASTFLERASAPGLAVGIVTPDGAKVFSYGVASKEISPNGPEFAAVPIDRPPSIRTESRASCCA